MYNKLLFFLLLGALVALIPARPPHKRGWWPEFGGYGVGHRRHGPPIGEPPHDRAPHDGAPQDGASNGGFEPSQDRQDRTPYDQARRDDRPRQHETAHPRWTIESRQDFPLIDPRSPLADAPQDNEGPQLRGEREPRFHGRLPPGPINATADACPGGLEPKQCIEDACLRATCETDSEAECMTNYCGNCEAIFFDQSGRRVRCEDDDHKPRRQHGRHAPPRPQYLPADVCPNGEEVVECRENPCNNATCEANPGATCVFNFCGGCNALFYDVDNMKVCCNKGRGGRGRGRGHGRGRHSPDSADSADSPDSADSADGEESDVGATDHH